MRGPRRIRGGCAPGRIHRGPRPPPECRARTSPGPRVRAAGISRNGSARTRCRRMSRAQSSRRRGGCAARGDRMDPGSSPLEPRSPRNRANRRCRWLAYHACRARSLVRRVLVASIVVPPRSPRDTPLGVPRSNPGCRRSHRSTRGIRGDPPSVTDRPGFFSPGAAVSSRSSMRRSRAEFFDGCRRGEDVPGTEVVRAIGWDPDERRAPGDGRNRRLQSVNRAARPRGGP